MNVSMHSTFRHSTSGNQEARGVAAIAVATVSAEAASIAGLRQSPHPSDLPLDGFEIPARFLLQADEQTVVGMAAVLRAIAGMGKAASEFRQWGAIGAPRFAGRSVGAVTLPKFQSGGAATISPHFIPQLSLHSLSGAISVALGMRGPNFGVGGGPNNVAEGLLAALSFSDASDAPGLWLVATEWSPELAVDAAGETRGPAPVCHAAAIAIVRDKGAGVALRTARDETPRLRIASDEESPPASLSVLELARLVSAERGEGPIRIAAFPGWSFEFGAGPVRERWAA